MCKKKEIKAKLGGNETSKEAEVVEMLPGVLKVPVAAIEKSFLHRELKRGSWRTRANGQSRVSVIDFADRRRS
jgi:aminoglycoside/choline kinase family phosphotransferase